MVRAIETGFPLSKLSMIWNSIQASDRSSLILISAGNSYVARIRIDFRNFNAQPNLKFDFNLSKIPEAGHLELERQRKKNYSLHFVTAYT